MKSSAIRAALLLAALVFSAAGFAPGEASAYTLKTLYSFCPAGGRCKDGNGPGPLVSDASGNLFGTAVEGGKYGVSGVVFELVPNADKSAWTYVVLHLFCPTRGCPDGQNPVGKLVVDTQGNLYGVTTAGGSGHGTAFKLSPGSPWQLTTIHSFCGRAGCADGGLPDAGLTYVGAASGALYDGTSPLYGTTLQGGNSRGEGTIFKLIPKQGRFVERVIYKFCSLANCADGYLPTASLLADTSGNLYGTTTAGGTSNRGTVFELSRTAKKQWSQTVLYSFCLQNNCTDGAVPETELLMDSSGNLFGTTGDGGSGAHCPDTGGCGTAFKIVPNGATSTESVLYNFCSASDCADGDAPFSAGFVMDGSGNLFSTTAGGGGNDGDPVNRGGGTVYQLNGTEQVIYAFCAQSGCTDGWSPAGSLIRDSSGNLFGVTQQGGTGEGANGGAGTVFELSP